MADRRMSRFCKDFEWARGLGIGVADVRRDGDYVCAMCGADDEPVFETSLVQDGIRDVLCRFRLCHGCTEELLRQLGELMLP